MNQYFVLCDGTFCGTFFSHKEGKSCLDEAEPLILEVMTSKLNETSLQCIFLDSKNTTNEMIKSLPTTKVNDENPILQTSQMALCVTGIVAINRQMTASDNIIPIRYANFAIVRSLDVYTPKILEKIDFSYGLIHERTGLFVTPNGMSLDETVLVSRLDCTPTVNDILVTVTEELPFLEKMDASEFSLFIRKDMM